MKTAVIYTRVSTEDQKENGFSLQDQESRLRKECNRKGYTIVEHYQDDHSAKDFNRPQFQTFLNDVKSKKIKPDIFFCIRMDRFTRNMLDGYEMLSNFKKWGITFETIENNITIDSPEGLVPFMLNMLMPQVENERRGLNTKRGMRQAVKEGRFPWKAPIGYLNDQSTKSIVIDSTRSNLIEFAFQTYSTGIYSTEQIRMMLVEKGLKTCKQNLINILKNIFYIGKIRLDAWKDEPEQIFEGLHDKLITDEVFYSCQDILNGKKKKLSRLNTRQENLPLRGHLQCAICGKKLTGSNSKSRNGSLHSYYHCQSGCKERFRADEANKVFVQYLQGFETCAEAQELYLSILTDVFKTNDADRQREKKLLEEQIETLQNRINNLNDKYVDGLINDGTYKETNTRYENSKNE